MIKIASVWQNTGKDGRTYYSGRIIGDLMIYVFPNKSNNPKSPMYDIMLSIPRKQEQRNKPETQEEPSLSDIPDEVYETDDEVPF